MLTHDVYTNLFHNFTNARFIQTYLRFVHRNVCMVPDCEFTHNVIRNDFTDSIKLNEKTLYLWEIIWKNMKKQKSKKITSVLTIVDWTTLTELTELSTRKKVKNQTSVKEAYSKLLVPGEIIFSRVGQHNVVTGLHTFV